MEATTDCLGLSARKIFKIVRESFSDLKVKTRNIIECKENILFVWDHGQCALQAINLRVACNDHTSEDFYQTLVPTDPPSFEVERLVINITTTQIAVVGSRGIAVLDLPNRWGKDAAFQGGRTSITCRCRTLDERYFLCNPHVELRRARWHPGSRRDSHLLVLTSDNSFRLYQTSAEGVQLLQVWPLGRQPSATLSSGPRLPFLVGLGDTAVDFDFAPPVKTSSLALKEDLRESAKDRSDAGAVVWPVFILRGNGDVYSLVVPLSAESTSKPVVHGPLSMYPPADDNYGVDACSILCLQTLPPVVVIATCSGTLYHSVLLTCAEDEDEDENDNTANKSSWSQYGSTYSLHTPDIALYVFESVELELGLALDDNDDSYTCPIHLHRDPASESRYFCTHDTGVHMMTLPFVTQLEEFAKSHDDSPPLDLLNQPSSVEYLICTRTSSSSPLQPILGIGITAPPHILITLLGTGEVVSLPLASLPVNPTQLDDLHGEEKELVSPLKMILKEPFDVVIKKLLKHSNSQPILKLGPNADPSPQECMELVNRTTQLFREEYFLKHDRVREEIDRRVRTLQTLKQHQLKELEHMEQEKVKLQQNAEQLAEKYEDIKDKQEELTKRAENALRLISQQQPVVSSAEKKLSADLKQVQEKLKEFKQSLEQVKAKQNYHKNQMEQWVSQQKKRELYLGQTHMKAIKASVAHMTTEIANLMKMVEISKKELGL